MVLAFEKGSSATINSFEDVDEIFIAAFTSESVANDWIAEHIPCVKDKVIYKDCLIRA